MLPNCSDSIYPRMLCGALLACVLSIPSLTLAQDGSPIIIGKRNQLKFFEFRSIQTSVEAYWRSHTDNSTSANGSKTKNTESLLRESFLLDTEGYFGNPNLVELTLSLNIRLSQEEIDDSTSGGKVNTDELINEYDVSALILKRGNTPLTVYSRRSQVLLDRQFATSLDSLNIEHGARLSLQSDFMPSQMHIFHREQEQTGRSGGADSKYTQDTFAWQGSIKSLGGHRFWWDYTFSDVEETGLLQAPNSFIRHDFTANHILSYGSEGKQSLRSSLKVLKETGRFPVDQIRLNESLLLRHTQNFETKYVYMYDQQERQSVNQTTHRGTASFRHDLFDSLTSTGQLGASILNISEGNFESQQYFGDFGFNYTKKVPYGVFDATINFNFNHQDDSVRGTSIFLTNISHTFGISDLITINRRNIVGSSIVITDATGLITYIEGIDYIVQHFGNNVEIQRVLGGNIPVGQSVLVTAEIGPEPANITDTTGVGVTSRYRINEGPLTGLSPYLRFQDQRQKRDSVSLISLPQNEFQDITLGADYHFGKISLLAEHQMHDSTLSPFNRTRFECRYTNRLGSRSVVLVSAFLQETDRYDENLQNTITNVTARWTTRPTERLHGSIVGIWRREEDNVGTNTNAYEIALDLKWQYRQTTVFCILRNSIINSNTRDSNIQTISIGVRRVF